MSFIKHIFRDVSIFSPIDGRDKLSYNGSNGWTTFIFVCIMTYNQMISEARLRKGGVNSGYRGFF